MPGHDIVAAAVLDDLVLAIPAMAFRAASQLSRSTKVAIVLVPGLRSGGGEEIVVGRVVDSRRELERLEKRVRRECVVASIGRLMRYNERVGSGERSPPGEGLWR